MKYYCILLLLIFCQPTFGQQPKRPLLVDPSDIEASVRSELDSWMLGEAYTKWKSKFKDVAGSVSYQLTVSGKGKIETVFQMETSITDVHFLNAFINKIKTIEFNMKMKKDERYKFRYNFNIH